jgi:hypothetical protein
VSGAAPWHALLAPIPAGAAPRRAPLDDPGGAEPIAGWESVVLELSAGGAGLRAVQATLDGEGRLISGSDHVLYRVEGAAGVEWHHASVGGRFEADGTFRGTRWRGTSPDDPDAEGPPPEPSTPSAADEAGLRAVLAEVLRRAPRP